MLSIKRQWFSKFVYFSLQPAVFRYRLDSKMTNYTQSEKMMDFRFFLSPGDETPIDDSLYDYVKRQTIFVMIY